MSTRDERARNRDTRRQERERLQREEQERLQREQERLQRIEGRKGRSKTLHSAVMARETTGSRVDFSRSSMIRNMHGEFQVFTPVDARRTWGAVFQVLLFDILGEKPYFRDLRIEDFSNEPDQLVVIRSVREVQNGIITGNALGSLHIMLRFNHPQVAVSTDPHPTRVDDWSYYCRTARQCRIELRPANEFLRFLRVLPRPRQDVQNNAGRTQRVERFSSWEHGIYKSRRPNEHFALYHGDYNTSEPAVQTVAMFIEEHYRLAAGGPAAAL
jgi:hypothetical protein